MSGVVPLSDWKRLSGQNVLTPPGWPWPIIW